MLIIFSLKYIEHLINTCETWKQKTSKHWPRVQKKERARCPSASRQNLSLAHGLEMVQEQNDIVSRVLRVLQEPDMFRNMKLSAIWVCRTSTWGSAFLKKKKKKQLQSCSTQTWWGVMDTEGVISVGILDATISNVLQSNYGASGRVTTWCKRCKRHASLHSVKPWFEEELQLCSMCLIYLNYVM